MATALILDKIKTRVKNIKTSDSFISRIIPQAGTVKIKQTLPFRIKITNIGVPSYSASNVPPIGIAVIGYNNYIL